MWKLVVMDTTEVSGEAANTTSVVYHLLESKPTIRTAEFSALSVVLAELLFRNHNGRLFLFSDEVA
jgi:hypothetical protein